MSTIVDISRLSTYEDMPMNPQLEDKSPAEAIRDREARDVMAAARAFINVGLGGVATVERGATSSDAAESTTLFRVRAHLSRAAGYLLADGGWRDLWRELWVRGVVEALPAEAWIGNWTVGRLVVPGIARPRCDA